MSIQSKISLLENGVIVPAAPGGAVSSSSEWDGFVVEHHKMEKGELPGHTILDHRLTITTGQKTVPFEFKENGKWGRVQLHPGSFSMQNHGDLGAPRWLDHFEFLAIAIKPVFFEKITSGQVQSRQVELITQRGKLDPNIQSFCQLFYDELSNKRYASQLYGETLSMAFALYLLNHYATGNKKITEPTGKLHGLQVKNLIDFVSSHLGSEIGLDMLSGQVHMSPFHFAKTFKRTTGLSPHQFVLKMRMEKAKELIKLKALSLTEIAHTTGFFDQSHFTHSFKRVVGISPRQYRQSL